MPRVLAIETSCDETSVAILSGTPRDPVLEGHLTLSHARKTQAYGGIVPEIVAREHLQYLEPLLEQTLTQARRSLDDIDLIAATCGPGLLGGLVIGTTTAKTLALARNIPFLAVNHLEGHALSPILSARTSSPPQTPPTFPYLLLLVSGGHCQLLLVQLLLVQLLLVRRPGKYRIEYRLLGQTRDDSAGECLDKGARLLKLSEASGAALEQAAQKGNPHRFAKEIAPLPQPMHNAEHGDFSFSGLKSALARAVSRTHLSEQQRYDGAAALQKAVFDSLCERSEKALRTLKAQNIRPAAFAVAGGVAANHTLYAQLKRLAGKHSLAFFAPRQELCTDNAAMIAFAALTQQEMLQQKESPKEWSEESQTEESQTEESQTEESQTEESQTEESQTEESQTEESQTEESQPLARPFFGHPLSYPVRPRWSLQEEGADRQAYVRPSSGSRKTYTTKTYTTSHKKTYGVSAKCVHKRAHEKP